ncbi:hypothetical protein ACFYV7_39335 [Nocardia suismassiliense]|uniref:Uncharacterized protein n=1 Tax=Nocardia suismassiliense TaxID=2077092 RepID=A0ABW6R5V0_9NOCA
MTAATCVADSAAVTPFASALAQIEYLLEVDPDRAREEFAAVLTLASPQERAFLEEAAAILSRKPFRQAAHELGWIAKNRPEVRHMVIHLTTDSNPDLYRPAMPDPSEVPIEAADWVRRSIRDYRRADRLTATPSRDTDDARFTPEAIAHRRARQPIGAAARRGLHDHHVHAWRRRQDIQFATYAAERLFAIETDTDLGAPIPNPRKPAHLVWAHVQAGLWDRSYFLYVAENYTERDRDLLTPPSPITRAGSARQGRYAALDDAAQTFLGEDTTDGARGDRRRGARRRWTNLPKRITPADQKDFARKRTGLPVPSDYDEFLPYTELDVVEDTRQGSGLDYDLAAMNPYHGWPCVGCWIDRCDSDLRVVQVVDGHRVSDDGLCGDCRDDGHPGIAPLPVPWGIEEFVQSRCAHIAATHPQQARAILDRIRAAAANTGLTWRIITRWMAMNLEQPTTPSAPRTQVRRRRQPAALGAGQRIGRCDRCTKPGVVHADSLCTACRAELTVIAERRRTSAA